MTYKGFFVGQGGVNSVELKGRRKCTLQQRDSQSV